MIVDDRYSMFEGVNEFNVFGGTGSGPVNEFDQVEVEAPASGGSGGYVAPAPAPGGGISQPVRPSVNQPVSQPVPNVVSDPAGGPGVDEESIFVESETVQENEKKIKHLVVAVFSVIIIFELLRA